MRIGIVDAELIYGKRHRFPNLACMKLAGYHKAKGDKVILITDPKDIIDSSLWDNDENTFDKIYVAKVFTKTEFPLEYLKQSNVVHGGTGFFFDKAEPLPDEIEHHMPDYTLYSKWVVDTSGKYKRQSAFNFYNDYSIGYLSRGCPRGCGFYVNKNNKKMKVWSPLEEFHDVSRKKLCFIDDNFLALKNREELLQKVIDTKKPYIFHQGLDFRMLDRSMMEMLNKSKYDGKLKFAFDNIRDAGIIEKQMTYWKDVTKSNNDAVFYVLVGFPHNGEEIDDAFWRNDIIDMWKRIEYLMANRCFAYIMRHENATSDKLDPKIKEFYNAVSCWANQTFLAYGSSFEQYLVLDTKYHGNRRHDTCMEVINSIPEIQIATKKVFKNMIRFK